MSNNDKDNKWRLHSAVLNCCHKTAADVLAEGNQCLEVNDRQKWSLLHRAALKGCSQCSRLLLKRGCDPDLQDALGQTAILLAALNRHHGVMKELIDARCDVNISNCESRTPLHEMAEVGDEVGTKMLLEARCDPNLQDRSSYTPLMLAAQNSHLPCIKALLRHHAQVDLVRRTKHTKQTALFIATTRQDHAIMQLILQVPTTATAFSTLVPSSLTSCTVSRSDGLKTAKVFLQAMSGQHQTMMRHSFLTTASGFRHEVTLQILHILRLAGYTFREDDLKSLKQTNPGLHTSFASALKQPLALRDICRINLRSHFGGSLTNAIPRLPLPSQMTRFLLMEDLDCQTDWLNLETF